MTAPSNLTLACCGWEDASILDSTELKRERWTASIVYTFRDHVANEMLMVNPLGLTITYFRQDQAFQ